MNVVHTCMHTCIHICTCMYRLLPNRYFLPARFDGPEGPLPDSRGFGSSQTSQARRPALPQESASGSATRSLEAPWWRARDPRATSSSSSLHRRTKKDTHTERWGRWCEVHCGEHEARVRESSGVERNGMTERNWMEWQNATEWNDRTQLNGRTERNWMEGQNATEWNDRTQLNGRTERNVT